MSRVLPKEKERWRKKIPKRGHKMCKTPKNRKSRAQLRN